MLVPEVVLCTQQAAAFIKGGVPKAAPFSGANASLNIENWDLKLKEYSVLVCTPQILVNILTKKPRLLQQVHLLVLDEVHHTSKEHPYAKVIQTWRSLKDVVSGRSGQLCCLECWAAAARGGHPQPAAMGSMCYLFVM
jgi:endoribonuclease Dicer